MTYEEMIATENTDSRRLPWRYYSTDVTDSILNFIENYYYKKKLQNQGKLRLSDYSLLQAIDDLGRKPLVAIWGAGGCNDFDLGMLSRFIQPVLIDRNLPMIEQARARAGLTDEECPCIDLKFWDIQEEDELDFQDCLTGVGDIDTCDSLTNLLHDIGTCAISRKLPNRKLFDFSVCFGLASQLNARFSSLLHIHNVDPFTQAAVASALRELNDLAGARLLENMISLTGNAILTGNELLSGTADDTERYNFLAEKISQDAQEAMAHGSTDYIHSNTQACTVEGSRQFLQQIEQQIHDAHLFCSHCFGNVWPFMPDKIYLMQVLALDIL